MTVEARAKLRQNKRTELSPGLSHRSQGPKRLNHHSLPSQAHWLGAGLETMQQNLNWHIKKG